MAEIKDKKCYEAFKYFPLLKWLVQLKHSREKVENNQPSALDDIKKERCPVITEINEDLRRMVLDPLLSQAHLGSLPCFGE